MSSIVEKAEKNVSDWAKKKKKGQSRHIISWRCVGRWLKIATWSYLRDTVLRNSVVKKCGKATRALRTLSISINFESREMMRIIGEDVVI